MKTRGWSENRNMKIIAICVILFPLELLVGCTPSATSQRTEESTETDHASQKEGKQMAGTKTKRTWDAFAVDDQNKEMFLGKITIDKGVLSIVSSDDEASRTYLEDIVEDMNALEFLVDKAPPKPGAGRYQLGAETYRRDHPDFESVLIRKLMENHALKVSESPSS